MAEKKATPAEKGLGAALISVGGVTLIKSLNIFEGGKISLDSVIHTELSGGGGGKTVVSDGGVDMACDPRWAINDFANGKAAALTAGGAQALDEGVRKAAKLIVDEHPAGTVVVMGSTNELSLKSPGGNAYLADQRAQVVARGLEKAFAGMRGEAPPRVIVGNDLIKAAGGAGDPAAPAGLARLLIGPKELGERAVTVCVVEARPHKIEVSGGGDLGRTDLFEQGFSTGLMAMAVMIIITGVVGWVLARALRKAWAENQKDDSAGKGLKRPAGKYRP